MHKTPGLLTVKGRTPCCPMLPLWPTPSGRAPDSDPWLHTPSRKPDRPEQTWTKRPEGSKTTRPSTGRSLLCPSSRECGTCTCAHEIGGCPTRSPTGADNVSPSSKLSGQAQSQSFCAIVSQWSSDP
ncbi:MAG: hypothetical protein [Huanggang Rhabd tick virus 1]|uniref:Uncharacterized protein n=1 Tax=Huanggang Rhabd tick virus 1 TaxID=2972320 RepID=A0A9E8AAK8_9RHAB|nr:MAG: hypothetical protein [Huanggang Rhabd tick virus 1]